MRLTLIFLSAVVCLILAAITRTMRGYGYTIRKAGTLPAEWEQIKADLTIDAAKLYTSAQAQRRADRRRILDQKGGAA